MSANVTILELLSIEKVEDLHFLKLKVFSYTNNKVIYWLIDNDTSEALQKICDFNGNDRYRLSLQSTYNQNSNLFLSYVTKTYRDTSRRIDFQCSDQYREQLEKIKNCRSINHLLSLDFLYAILPKHQEVVKESIQSEMIAPKEMNDSKETENESNGTAQVDEAIEESETITSEESIQEKIENQVEAVIEEDTKIQEQIDNEEISSSLLDEEKDNDLTTTIKSNKKKASKKKRDVTRKAIQPVHISSQTIITACLIGAILLITLIIIFDTYSQSKGNEEPIISSAFVETEDMIESDPQSILIADSSTMDDEDSTVPTLQIDDFITFHIPEGYVALTFNDGPTKYTKSIVDILNQYDVGGTFFFIGYNVQKHPSIAEYVCSNGFTIGSYTMTFATMNEQTKEEQQYELSESKKIIEETIGASIHLFRPPFGLFNEETQKVAEEEQCKIILWNNDPKVQEVQSVSEIIENLKNNPTSGSIITLNESQQVVEALPSIIEYLQQQGLTIVSLN